jgi:hypothetical protein
MLPNCLVATQAVLALQAAFGFLVVLTADPADSLTRRRAAKRQSPGRRYRAVQDHHRKSTGLL